MLATVLFTDIVGSTERAAELGDKRWQRCSMRTTVPRPITSSGTEGGFIKHTGDGVLATFDGPARGIRCARAISDELSGAGIRVRSDLHAGEVELRGETSVAWPSIWRRAS